MNDLFDEEELFGFDAAVASEISYIFRKYISHKHGMTYPYNHIKVKAEYGGTELKKPTKGLSPAAANKLKKQGYDVTYDLESETWTIKWG